MRNLARWLFAFSYLGMKQTFLYYSFSTHPSRAHTKKHTHSFYLYVALMKSALVSR